MFAKSKNSAPETLRHESFGSPSSPPIETYVPYEEERPSLLYWTCHGYEESMGEKNIVTMIATDMKKTWNTKEKFNTNVQKILLRRFHREYLVVAGKPPRYFILWHQVHSTRLVMPWFYKIVDECPDDALMDQGIGALKGATFPNRAASQSKWNGLQRYTLQISGSPLSQSLLSAYPLLVPS